MFRCRTCIYTELLFLNMPKSKKAKKKQIDLASFEIKHDVVIPPFKIQNVVSTFSLGVSGGITTIYSVKISLC